MSVLLKRDALCLGQASFHVQQVIDDDPVEPGAKAAASVEGRKPCEELDQDFLRGVLGILWAMHHSQRDVVNPGLMMPDEFLQGGVIAVLGQTNELPVLSVTWIIGQWLADRFHIPLDTGECHL